MPGARRPDRGAGPTVVFTRTKHGAKALARQLNARGVPGRRAARQPVAERPRPATSPRSPTARRPRWSRPTSPPAASTSTTSSLVVHADPPVEHKAYLHRSGRTARAGAEGTVVTLMTGRPGQRRPRPHPPGRHQADDHPHRSPATRCWRRSPRASAPTSPPGTCRPPSRSVRVAGPAAAAPAVADPSRAARAARAPATAGATAAAVAPGRRRPPGAPVRAPVAPRARAARDAAAPRPPAGPVAATAPPRSPPRAAPASSSILGMPPPSAGQQTGSEPGGVAHTEGRPDRQGLPFRVRLPDLPAGVQRISGDGDRIT